MKKHKMKPQVLQYNPRKKIIQVIGQQICAARKPNRAKEATMRSTKAIRRLAKLTDLTRVGKTEEMFKVSNTQILEEAIHTFCDDGSHL